MIPFPRLCTQVLMAIVLIVLLALLQGCGASLPTAPSVPPFSDPIPGDTLAGEWQGLYRVTACKPAGVDPAPVCAAIGYQWPFRLHLEQSAARVSGQMTLSNGSGPWGPIDSAPVQMDRTALVGSVPETQVNAYWDLTPADDALGGTVRIVLPEAELLATLIGGRE